jgi:hypothetical protein
VTEPRSTLPGCLRGPSVHHRAQGSEENRLAKRSAQSLSRPATPTERPQAARLPQQIHSVPDTSERPLQAEADIKPQPRTKIYYRVTVPDSGTLEAGDVVIKLNGIVARKADAQCQDGKGKNWPCGAAAKTALRRSSSATCPSQASRSRSRRAVPFPAPTSPPGWCGKAGRSQTTFPNNLLDCLSPLRSFRPKHAFLLQLPDGVIEHGEVFR